MKLFVKAAAALATTAVVSAQNQLAYLSHKGKAFDVDGYGADGFTYTGFNKFGKDKFGRSYTEAGSGNAAEVDAGGRKMPPNPVVTTSTDADPTESGDWENYWPSFKDGRQRIHMEDGHKRAKNGKLIDKAWYHLSNRPLPTVTETQTQFQFTEVFITSSVQPTDEFWCDGGWIQITKTGDLMDDEWAVAFITGYLNALAVNVDDVDTYDWCVNTKDKNNTGACAYQYAASHSQADIDAAFAAATDDHTSQIILHVCNLVCLETMCAATQDNVNLLPKFRIEEVVFTKTSASDRNVSTPCLDGDDEYFPDNGNNGKTFIICPAGEVCDTTNPGDPNCQCQRCKRDPGSTRCTDESCESCLRPTCKLSNNGTAWTSQPTCPPREQGLSSCKQGFYRDTSPAGLCQKCPAVEYCIQTECIDATSFGCAYGGEQDGFSNTAPPGGFGAVFCQQPSCQPCDNTTTPCATIKVRVEADFPDRPDQPVTGFKVQFTKIADLSGRGRRAVGDSFITVTDDQGVAFITAEDGKYSICVISGVFEQDGEILEVQLPEEGNGLKCEEIDAFPEQVNLGPTIVAIPEGTAQGRAYLSDNTPISGLPITYSPEMGQTRVVDTNGNGTASFGPFALGEVYFMSVFKTFTSNGQTFTLTSPQVQRGVIGETPPLTFIYAPPGEVSGTMTQAGAGQTRLAGIEVSIQCGAFRRSVTTGVTGTYEFTNVPENSSCTLTVPSGNTPPASEEVLSANGTPLFLFAGQATTVFTLNGAMVFDFSYGNSASPSPSNTPNFPMISPLP